VAVKVTGGTAPGLYCYHTDAAGSVVAITKAVTGAQTLVATYAYGPFGEQTGSTGTDPIASRNPLRYRGYYTDGATGLYYLPARYYDPDVARFLSKDPAPPVAGDPGSLNAYAYCLGDPVNLEDPSGAIADYDGNGKLDSWDSAWSASRHASDRRRRDHFRQRAASRYYSARLPEPEDRLDPGSLAFLDEQARQRELLSRHICADPGYLDIDVNAWIVSFGIQVAPDGLYGYLGPGLGYGCSVTGSPNHATEGWCASSSAGFIGGGKVGSAIGEDVDEALLRYDSGDSSLFWGAGFVVGASGDAVFVNRIIEW
jgi:RHS repeat-associated protein